jgi:Ser/Thr protein kinase RdoA (MazF antagonist)
VHRPPGPSPQLAREVLLHLERSGFEAAPRWLGLDGQGRDILSWIEGETLVERGRMHPFVGDPAHKIAFVDDQLRAVFRLLRRYHDAFEGDVICHGDFGPWNLVWRGGLPVGVIDFDDVRQGEASEDVAYALRAFVSYGLAEAEPPELVRRTRIALDAYGRTFDVPVILAEEYERVEERCRCNGWLRALARLPAERAWLEANRTLF